MRGIKPLLLAVLVMNLLGMTQVALSRQSSPPISITPTSVLSGHTGWTTDLAWSPDGTILASSSGDYTATDYTVRLWNVGSNALVVVDNGARTYSLAWSPDGTLLASGTEVGKIKLIRMDGTVAGDLEGENGVVYTLNWSPDGETLAAGVSSGTSHNRVQLWSKAGILLKTLPTKYSGGKFYNVSWSPDGKYLVGGAIDYTLWTADGTVVFVHDRCEHCTPVWALVWSPDSRMWAIGDENGTVYVYSTKGEMVAQLQSEVSVDALAWSPDGQLLAGGNSLWYWNGTTFEQHRGHFNGRTALAWSPDGQLLAASFSNTQQVRMVSRRGDLIAVLEEEAICMAWSPNGHTMATGASNGMIYLWDTSSLEQTRVNHIG